MEIKFPQERMFNDVKYRLYDRYIYSAKYKAQEDANRLHKQGKLARVVPFKAGYIIFVR
jgi:hypothetical protein